MLISPAEPASLRALGTVSSQPERFGADFLWPSPVFGAVGVQRKELNDFVASCFDDRLDRELGQMKALGLAVMLLEGRPRWTNDGMLMGCRSRWPIAMHRGRLWSIHNAGVWVETVDSMMETVEWLGLFQTWTSKARHGRRNRKAPRDEWGTRKNADWGNHLLQGFDGIGYETAKAVIDAFGGVPLQWTVGEKELMAVKGIGKHRAAKMMEALAHESPKPD